MGLGDLALVQLLLAVPDGAACQRHAERAADAYRAALARGASLREAGSVREHLEFLIELTETWPESAGEALAAVRAAL